MTSFYSEYCLALLQPLARHRLQLLGQLQGEFNRGCSWLFEGRTSLFPLLEGGQRHRGQDVRSAVPKLAVSVCHWWGPTPTTSHFWWGNSHRSCPVTNLHLPWKISIWLIANECFLDVFNTMFSCSQHGHSRLKHKRFLSCYFFSEHHWFSVTTGTWVLCRYQSANAREPI